ncbi:MULTISPECIES: TlpA family protein disulfide reductase [unclassified Pedobacter]|uniref:TlpA family protein disulfide reductase n=1 Tax=unclassified Pedobacter TaxID=2628915 RepID=UPI00141E0A3C|nr:MULTISPECIES: TlpA family protein disulfide reductase [unclassified Pedobacter]NII83073.1 thiol-disulfide isomerase/thioredoxin [Pedobacter sp. SG908]NMN37091.1 thiol-disulfide isomerase/thioredoxin [Pedobacter sp. SG918]
MIPFFRLCLLAMLSVLACTSLQAQPPANKADALHKKLLAEMISLPAPNFTLKDLAGNVVSLKDLKGKVIVLDFWSTWCVPCKKSFPAMQLAVNTYKNDLSVKFLFIHTWETSKTPVEDVKKYIAQSGFNFQVLMDLKDEAGRNAAVEDYGVIAIPAKFVIDKAGNIVFKLTGFTGTDAAALQEISERITLAKNHK